jgi:ABC-type bacteriocin/lantibiotic exporter with double-glycine peptidase domain
VIDGGLSLGMLIANVRIIHSIGEIWSEIYTILQQVIECGPGLKNLSHLMNIETDLSARRDLAIINEDILVSEQGKWGTTATACKHGFQVFDALPIEVRDISVSSPQASETLNVSGYLQVMQGEIVTVIGPHHGGKTMLLKILGGSMLPEIPPGGRQNAGEDDCPIAPAGAAYLCRPHVHPRVHRRQPYFRGHC